jgi:hypothetical protein
MVPNVSSLNKPQPRTIAVNEVKIMTHTKGLTLILLLGLGSVGAVFYLLSRDVTSSDTQAGLSTAVESSQSARMASVPTSRVTTKMPAVDQAPTPQVNAGRNEVQTVAQTKERKQMVFTKKELAVHPKAWLFAYSAEDADWQDRNGFPTMDEDKRLESLSDADLIQLGTLNAKTPLALRRATNAVKAGNAQEAEFAYNAMMRIIEQGGPYQVGKTIEMGTQLMTNARATEALGDAHTKALKQVLESYDIAVVQARAYGDELLHSQISRNSGTRERLTPVINSSQSVYFALKYLSDISRVRVSQGLPPSSFDPRPRAFIDDTHTVYVR